MKCRLLHNVDFQGVLREAEEVVNYHREDESAFHVEIGHNSWIKLVKGVDADVPPKARTVYLFTNRNCLVFDDKGEQLAWYQRAISCYDLDPELAKEVARDAQEIFLSRWREWSHSITKKEFEYLLGLRTKEMDLADTEWGQKLLEKEHELSGLPEVPA